MENFFFHPWKHCPLSQQLLSFSSPLLKQAKSNWILQIWWSHFWIKSFSKDTNMVNSYSKYFSEQTQSSIVKICFRFCHSQLPRIRQFLLVYNGGNNWGNFRKSVLSGLRPIFKVVEIFFFYVYVWCILNCLTWLSGWMNTKNKLSDVVRFLWIEVNFFEVNRKSCNLLINLSF